MLVMSFPHFIFYRGLIVGSTPLTRSLPDISTDIKGVLLFEDDDGVELNNFPESLDIYSGILALDSGIMDHMFSSSRTTSAILGRASGSSLVHFKARFKNFAISSEGYGPMRGSITENTSPDWYATVT